MFAVPKFQLGSSKSMKWAGKKHIWPQKWVKNGYNIDIYRNLPNRLTPQPRRRFKSYKIFLKILLYIYILNIKYPLSFQTLKNPLYRHSKGNNRGNFGWLLLDSPTIPLPSVSLTYSVRHQK
jgi:hypothetical protein